LVFLILLLNDKEVMGKYKNSMIQNVVSVSIVIVIIVLSTLYAISTLFPNLFK
jgi:Mn2+/Fe2+ NRAMP family transporter